MILGNKILLESVIYILRFEESSKYSEAKRKEKK